MTGEVIERLSTTDVLDALWETMQEYGVTMEGGEKVAVARRLAHEAAIRNPKRRVVTRLDVLKALRLTSLRVVPAGFAAAVERRLRRVLTIREGSEEGSRTR